MIFIPRYTRAKEGVSFVDFDDTLAQTSVYLQNLPYSIPYANDVSLSVQSLGLGNGIFRMIQRKYGAETLQKIIDQTHRIFVENMFKEFQTRDTHILTAASFFQCQRQRLQNVFSPDQSLIIVPTQKDKIHTVTKYLRQELKKKILPKEIRLFDDRLFGNENIYPPAALQELEERFDVPFQSTGIKQPSSGNTCLVDVYSS